MFNYNRFKYYSPDDSGGGDSLGTPLTVDAIEDALNAPDDDKDETLDLGKKIDKVKADEKTNKENKEDKEVVKEDKEESDDDSDDEDTEDEDELKALEEDLKDKDDDEDELIIVAPPRRQEILKEFPGFFKKFPDMEKMMYRERDYTEIFGTVRDAKEVKQLADNFKEFEKDVMSGNIESILVAAKNADTNSLHKIVDNFLPLLHKVDQPAYTHVMTNVVKHMLRGAAHDARDNNDEDLNTAILILHKHLFKSEKLETPKPLARAEDTKKDDDKRYDEERTRQRYNETRDDLTGRIDNSLRRTIDQYIDTKSLMTPFIKKNAINNALETTKDLIDKDTRFKAILDKLWERVFADNFSRNSVEKLESAFKTKAKTILPQVIIKTQREALQGLGRRVKSNKAEDEDDTNKSIRGPQKDKQNEDPSSKRKGQDNKIPKGMSTYDYLTEG